MHSSPDAPATNPIVLHADTLAAEDEERAPQTQFVAERQVAFLEALAVTGNVRTAARRARVSHQTCYRARRGSAAFGRAWDAALVVARGAAEAQLADYAVNGVEEEVWYHGELAGTRRRFSDRLLLAHLARLDRMRKDARIEALAEDFDALLTRMRRGEAIEVEPAPAASAGEGGFSPPGPCNMRSMSHEDEGQEPDEAAWDEEPARSARDADLLEEMAEARPADAPTPLELGGERRAIEACQMEAYAAGDEDWWRYGEGWVLYGQDARGRWVPEADSVEDG